MRLPLCAAGNDGALRAGMSSVESTGEADESGLAAAETLKAAAARMAWRDGSSRVAVMVVAAGPTPGSVPLPPSAVRRMPRVQGVTQRWARGLSQRDPYYLR